MAQNGWIGAANISARLTDAWVGINNVAQRVIAGYIGDENGKAQLCYKIGDLQFIGTRKMFDQQVWNSSCGRLQDKFVMAGGRKSYGTSSGSEVFLTDVEAMSTNLVRTTLADLIQGREYIGTGDIGGGVLFAAGGRISSNPSGGSSYYYDSSYVDLYAPDGMHTTTNLSSARWECTALKLGEKMCVCGGNQSISTGFLRQNVIDIFDDSGLLVQTVAMPISTYGFVGVSHQGKVILGGGRPSNTTTDIRKNVYALDEDGLFTSLADLDGFVSKDWSTGSAASGGDYAYFITDPLNNGNPTAEAYDEDFLKVLPNESFPDDTNYLQGVSTILDGVFWGGFLEVGTPPYPKPQNIYVVSNETISKIEGISPPTDNNYNAIGAQVDSLLFLFGFGDQVYVYSY